MKSFLKRWYEKDDYLKAFMNLLEQLPIDQQCEIAVDIIIEASNKLDRNYEKIIADVGEYNPKDFKRWYDKNPNLHLAIESLKDLEPNQREEIIKNYSEKILTLLGDEIEGLSE